MQLLERDPDRRPRDASELLNALESLECEPWDPSLLLRFDQAPREEEASTLHACTLKMHES